MSLFTFFLAPVSSNDVAKGEDAKTEMLKGLKNYFTIYKGLCATEPELIVDWKAYEDINEMEHVRQNYLEVLQTIRYFVEDKKRPKICKEIKSIKIEKAKEPFFTYKEGKIIVGGPRYQVVGLSDMYKKLAALGY